MLLRLYYIKESRINYQLKCSVCEQDINIIGPISVIHCRSRALIEFGDLLKLSALRDKLSFEDFHLISFWKRLLVEDFRLVISGKKTSLETSTLVLSL